jgi:hypothetical protein
MEDPEEAGGVWTVNDGSPVMYEDFKGMEFIFVAEIADVEALEPHMLTEAKCRLIGPPGRKPLRKSWPYSRPLALGGWKMHCLESTSSAPNGFSRPRRTQQATLSTIRPISSLRALARSAVLTTITPMCQ